MIERLDITAGPSVADITAHLEAAQKSLAAAQEGITALTALCSAMAAQHPLEPAPAPAIIGLRPLNRTDIGQIIEGKNGAPVKGIYFGVWYPVDRKGVDLKCDFDQFAAPTDIPRPMLTFKNAVKKVAALRNWHGHDGARMPNDEAVYKAIRNGNHAELSKWFIPTREILDGKNVDGTKIQTDNLYDNKATGAFNTTFVTSSGSGNAHWYWSCTERRDNSSHVWLTRFSDGDGGWGRHKDNFELSTRPVRAELRL